MAALALYFAIGLKWDDWGLQRHWTRALELGPVIPALLFLTFQLFGLYKGRWRHASLEELLRPTLAVLLTGAVAFVANTVGVASNASLSFFAVFTLILLFLANGSGSSYRLLAYWRSRASKPEVPVLLYGAGRRGSMALRELSGESEALLRPVVSWTTTSRRRGSS